jgi:hypothetical protein
MLTNMLIPKCQLCGSDDVVADLASAPFTLVKDKYTTIGYRPQYGDIEVCNFYCYTCGKELTLEQVIPSEAK